MAFTYDLTTSIGQVRMLIPDRAHSVETPALFTDAELTALLSLEDSDVRRAAAQALEIILTDEVRLERTITSASGESLTWDRAAQVQALRQRAATLRQDAADAEADDEPLFATAELVTNPFTARERRFKQAQRGRL